MVYAYNRLSPATRPRLPREKEILDVADRFSEIKDKKGEDERKIRKIESNIRDKEKEKDRRKE